MSGLFSHLEDFFEGSDKKTSYKYNYAYLPPISMIQKVPSGDVAAAWLGMAAVSQLKITVNLLAIAHDAKAEDLDAKVDQLDKRRGKMPHLAFMLEVAGLFREIAKEAEQLGAHLIEDIDHLLVELTKPSTNIVIVLLDIILAFQNQLLKDMFFEQMPSPAAFDDLFITLDRPKVSETWSKDETFADLRVAGPNPVVLERMTQPLENFPVTDKIFKKAMGGCDDLSTAMSQGRVYVVNYSALEGLLTGSFMGPQKYLGAPIAMFAVPESGDDKRLKPVAVQCGQTPGPDFPIWSPAQEPGTSDAYAWEMAKIFFNASDGNFHEAIAHLGWTHMVVSPFSVATPNQLGKNHPVGRLLLPHFKGTFSINNAAANSLIYSEGIIDQIMGGTIDASRAVAAAGCRQRTRHFEEGYLSYRLKQRGVDDTQALPYYPYRDCALLVWNAIDQWTADYLQLCYPNEDDPAKDEPLQNWLAELVAHEGGRVGMIGQDGAIRTRSYLQGLLTMVIFTGSAQHAAVNFPQLGIMSYPPAMPLAAYAPPPAAGKTYTEKDVAAILPRKAQAVIQMNTGTLLGGLYYTRLGQYQPNYFKDPAIQKALASFQENLNSVEEQIEKTYPEYPYLLPSQIPRSINI
ncbi:MAG: lipoxygenase family protein [Acidobacteriota bacterium]|nr:lipoxygenase family protein [Acidobacteriota bacterium]